MSERGADDRSGERRLAPQGFDWTAYAPRGGGFTPRPLTALGQALDAERARLRDNPETVAVTETVLSYLQQLQEGRITEREFDVAVDGRALARAMLVCGVAHADYAGLQDQVARRQAARGWVRREGRGWVRLSEEDLPF